jgi:hypothetical protein
VIGARLDVACGDAFDHPVSDDEDHDEWDEAQRDPEHGAAEITAAGQLVAGNMAPYEHAATEEDGSAEPHAGPKTPSARR